MPFSIFSIWDCKWISFGAHKTVTLLKLHRNTIPYLVFAGEVLQEKAKENSSNHATQHLQQAPQYVKPGGPLCKIRQMTLTIQITIQYYILY